MSYQQIASLVRQAAALAATIVGVLSASGTGLHLPVAVQSILTAAAPVLFSIEHFVSDPSTGTPTPPSNSPTFKP